MDTGTFWLLFSGITAFSNRVTEAFKKFLKINVSTLSDVAMQLISLLVSIVAGVVGALFLNLNFIRILPSSPLTANVSDLAGVLATGFLASVGSESLHWFFDLLETQRNKMEESSVGGFTQESKTVFTPPAGAGTSELTGASVQVTTPAGSATITPAPAPEENLNG